MDGEDPQAGLVQATDGNLYGMTAAGGANADGTIFEITPSGAFTTLHSFCSQEGCKDGKQQVNIGPLPPSLAGAGSVNIVLTADGQAANTVNVTIVQ